MSVDPPASFRALIVDDDEMSRHIAAEVLKRLGATEVIESADGPSALDWADGNNDELDLVMCDLRMPQVDGLETLAGLALRTRPSVFVLASSADPRLLRAAAAMAAQSGIKRLHVISKPVTPENMQEAVALLGDTRSADDQRWEAQTATPLDCSTKILRGLSGGEFVPFFQPRWDRRSRSVVGVEAHLRWRLPIEGLFAPEAFIDVAESTGLLNELFLGVLVQVATSCAEWRRQGRDLNATIELPLSLLASKALPRQLEDLVTTYGTSPEQITFELTEANWLRDRERVGRELTHLRLRGFGVAISHFGTGYASVKQFIHSPMTEIKIAPSFVRNAPYDTVAAAALASCVLLARELDLTVVADGLESSRQYEHASELGCDRLQGPFLGPLMPADEFERWIASPHQPALDPSDAANHSQLEIGF